MRRDAQLDKILLDYDENSVITTYDQTADEKQTYEGVEVRQRNRTQNKLDDRARSNRAPCF